MIFVENVTSCHHDWQKGRHNFTAHCSQHDICDACLITSARLTNLRVIQFSLFGLQFHAHHSSTVDYCNVVFAGLPSVTLAPLRRILNAAVRFVAGLGPRHYTLVTLNVRCTGFRWTASSCIHSVVTHPPATFLVYESIHGLKNILCRRPNDVEQSSAVNSRNFINRRC